MSYHVLTSYIVAHDRREVRMAEGRKRKAVEAQS